MERCVRSRYRIHKRRGSNANRVAFDVRRSKTNCSSEQFSFSPDLGRSSYELRNSYDRLSSTLAWLSITDAARVPWLAPVSAETAPPHFRPEGRMLSGDFRPLHFRASTVGDKCEQVLDTSGEIIARNTTRAKAIIARYAQTNAINKN